MLREPSLVLMALPRLLFGDPVRGRCLLSYSGVAVGTWT